jgi:putative phage-type endonuclease
MKELTYKARNGLVLDLNYKPEVFCEDITKLTNEEWLQNRRTGIGGSDYGILYGLSIFKTARDLFKDKLGYTPYWEPKNNWFTLEVGHALEELVAKAFYERTGYKPYAVRKMFRHPVYYWMIADVDYFVDIRDSEGNIRTYILEIKTTSYQNKDKWGDDFAPQIPPSYILQGRSYACVTNVSGIIYACLYDNKIDSLIIRTLERDLDEEAELIEAGRHFWQDYVESGIEPPYTEVGKAVKLSAKKWIAPSKNSTIFEIDGNDNVVNGDEVEGSYEEVFAKIDSLKEKSAALDKQKQDCEKEITRLQAVIEANIGEEKDCIINLAKRNKNVGITFDEKFKESVPVSRIRDLKKFDKDLYDYLIGISFIKQETSKNIKFYDKIKARV